jgi:hypothetical protein
VQVDVPLSNMGLNLFVEGRQKLVRGRISCAGEIKKIKKEIVEEGSSSVAQDEGGAAHQANKQPHGGIPWPQPYEGSMSNASMGEWGNHATTSSTIHVPHEVFMALHPINARRYRKHCLSSWSPSPLEQFRGGPAQS